MKLRATHQARTAYHEAGHAVLAHVGGLQVFGMSVERDGDSFGRTFYGVVAAWPNGKKTVDCRMRRRVEASVLCYLAGLEAEARFAGRRDHRGASADMREAAEIARRVVLSEEELEPYLRWLAARVRHLVVTHWPLIDGLARRLLLNETMSAREVQAALRALSHAPRGRIRLRSRVAGGLRG